MKKIKVVICGPPHSGKSVFTKVITTILPHDRFAVVEAAPDGEGITGWYFDGDREVAKKIRKKGKFSQHFINVVCEEVKTSTADITLIDVGGIRSKENAQIFAEATHFVVLSSNPRETEEWIKFGKAHTCEPVAIFDSQLSGKDEIFSLGDIRNVEPLKARITKLEREDPPYGSLAAKALVECLLAMAPHGSAGTDLPPII